MSVLGQASPISIGGQSVADAIRTATTDASRAARQTSGLSLTQSHTGHRIASVILGVYLAYYVGRVQEIFPVLAVPRLPMIMVIVLVALTIGGMPLAGWQRIWHHSLPMRLMTVFIGIVIATIPFGIWVGGSWWFLINRYWISVVVFFACLVLLRDRRNLRLALGAFVLAMTVVTIWAMSHPQPMLDEDGDLMYDDTGMLRMGRLGIGVSLDPNDFGAVLVTAIPMAIYLGIGGFFRRLFWWGAALVLVVGIVPTASRGAMLGLAVVALVLIGQGASVWRRILLSGLVILGAALFTATSTPEESSRFGSIGADDYNFTESEGRIAIWKRGLVWMTWRPWGYGIDNFPTYFAWMNGPERAAHNSFIQIGVETGIAGLAVFSLLCLRLGQGGSRQRRTAAAISRTASDPASRSLSDHEAWLAGCGVAMLAGTLTTGFFLSNAYYGLMYMALGTMAAILLGFPWRLPPSATKAAAPPAPPGRIRRPRRTAASTSK